VRRKRIEKFTTSYSEQEEAMSFLNNQYLSNNSLPAWLQAFAALVALGISAWAVVRTGAAERRRDRLKARSIAVAIYPEFLKLQVLIADIPAHLERLKQTERVVGQNVAYKVMGAQLEMPAMVERNIDNLYPDHR
jgi:hypothetical protein